MYCPSEDVIANHFYFDPYETKKVSQRDIYGMRG